MFSPVFVAHPFIPAIFLKTPVLWTDGKKNYCFFKPVDSAGKTTRMDLDVLLKKIQNHVEQK
jgi:hypothetical protein